MKTQRKLRSPAAIALAVAAGLLAAPLLSTTSFGAATPAPANADQKMALMAQALAARDAGDLAKARDLLLQLQQLAPDDAFVKRDLADIEADLARRQQGQPTVFGAAGQSAAGNQTAAAATPAPAAGSKPTAAPAISPEAMTAMQAQAAAQRQQITATGASIQKAEAMMKAGDFDGARDMLTMAKNELPEQGIGYNEIKADIEMQTAETWYQQAVAAYNKNKTSDAEDALKQYITLTGGTADARATKLQGALKSAVYDPTKQDEEAVSPGFAAKQEHIKQLLTKGRAQFLYGDYTGALKTFEDVTALDADNYMANAYEKYVTQIMREKSFLIHEMTREDMLLNVDYQWRRPIVYSGKVGGQNLNNAQRVLQLTREKLKKIIYPQIEYVDSPLNKVVDDLNQTSPDYDNTGIGVNEGLAKGINIVLVPDPTNPPPSKISFALRANSLESILNTITTLSNGYTWGIEEGGTVYIRHGGVTGETRIFPMPRSVITLLLGYQSGGAAAGATSGGNSSATTPFDASAAGSGDLSPTAIEDGLKGFFIRAGALNDDAKIAFDGSKIYVTTNASALDKLANLLRRYNEVRQVEIESRFLDVQQGVLHELGMRWTIFNPNSPTNFAQTGNNLRSLAQTFPLGSSTAFEPTVVQGIGASTNAITGAVSAGSNLTIPQTIPSLPNGINVNPNASNMFQSVLGVLDGYRVQAVINAIDQSQGTDLMSAPKVTVLSTKTATITVAQVLRYPTSFAAIQSQVSPASGNNSGSSGSGGVTITAGTPQDFQEQQVGVVMEVTPVVEEDDSISLHLDPQVTEFEGFVEYGGTSIAIQSGTVATVPSGFIQPIFDIRQVRTEVTIFDGATVVMGGLTRDEVKTVNDSIPVLSKIPLIGRLFTSKGETSQKRNLMIFVTASLISPGGSLAKRPAGQVMPGSLYESPTIITPGLAERRTAETSGTAPAATAP